jgi:hypothetical protein
MVCLFSLVSLYGHVVRQEYYGREHAVEKNGSPCKPQEIEEKEEVRGQKYILQSQALSNLHPPTRPRLLKTPLPLTKLSKLLVVLFIDYRAPTSHLSASLETKASTQ